MTGPQQWWGLFGPEHGVEWLIETRASEIALGDTLYSPFVACGKCQVPIYPRVLSRYRHACRCANCEGSRPAPATILMPHV